MKTRIIEASNALDGSGMNWGKFMLSQFDDAEWNYISALDKTKLLHNRGWTREHIWVYDLQTGEGAIFRHGGLASADLNKHKIWVCPLFEPFLVWLYTQPLDIDKLPALVDLKGAASAVYGYRREGK